MERIVLFDGVCNFCNGAVNFIIRHDRDNKFKFAALQSHRGMELRAKYGIGDDVDSIILIEDNAAHLHSGAGIGMTVGSAFLYSNAALQIARALGGVFSLLFVFVIVPTPIRDWFYRLFARYRYRLFGKRDVCMVPGPEVTGRFLS